MELFFFFPLLAKKYDTKTKELFTIENAIYILHTMQRFVLLGPWFNEEKRRKKK